MGLDSQPQRSLDLEQTEQERIFNELTDGVKNDEGFKKFLGPEYRDLDEAIGPLIYSLWKKQLVKTRASCSGHVGPSHLDAGRAVTPGNFVYRNGYILFEDMDEERTEKFFQLVERLRSEYPFISIQKSDKQPEWKSHTVKLLMDDIAVITKLPVPETSWPREVKEIPIPLAEERFKLFREAWKKLALEVMRTSAE